LLLVTACLAVAGSGDDRRPIAGGEYVETVPDSSGCVGNVVPDTAPTPAGTSTTALGPQPAGYELRAPAGHPHGVVLVIHGGGWVDVGPGQLDFGNVEAERWVRAGWATANLDYRACAQSLPDVVRLHDAIRERIGGRTPIVVVGESAGAQLALVLAARRPRSIAAVIGRAPPTDPDGLAAGQAYDPRTGAMDSPLPAQLADSWRIFAADLPAATPLALVPDITARVLVARSRTDPLIPQGQVDGFAEALRRAHPGQWVRALDLDGGTLPFPHATITPEAQATYDASVAEIVAPWTTSDPGDQGVPDEVDGWWPADGG
jgi:acetyl esterase/lipase